MTLTNILALLTGLALTNVNAAPADLSTTPTTTSVTRIITCELEGKKKSLSQFMAFASLDGLDSALRCSGVCKDRFHSSRCKSFAYNADDKSCAIYDVAVEQGADALAGTGTYFWDIGCWPDEPSSTATPSPAPCLPDDAVCDFSGTMKDADNRDWLGIYWGVNDPVTAELCSEMCADEYHAPLCKAFQVSGSFRWYSGKCTFFSYPLAGLLDPVDGEPNYWDLTCWKNSGACAKNS